MNRIVTGYDANGEPAVIFQGEPPTVIHAGRYTTTELWVSGRSPLAPAGTDESAREWALEPPPGGACFRIVEIAPGAPGSDGADEGSVSAAGHAEFQGAHSTDTLDCVTILRGEVTLVVGGAQIVLRAGDSVVQQPGVPHDWQNRSGETAVMIGVLISAH
jgi:mannose-6-phosphate isomerase-like protein (cupin superfamily)